MAEQRFSVPSDPTKTAATQRTSPRAESNQTERDARAAPKKPAASVGNRAPTHGGGVSGGVLPLRTTTTAADSTRDARAAPKKPAASVGNRAPTHGGGVSGGVLPLRTTTTAADSTRDARAAPKKPAASVGNRAPTHGGGVSGGVLPLRTTTTAADSTRDARAAPKKPAASVGNRAPRHGGGVSGGVLPLRTTTTAADSTRDARAAPKKGASLVAVAGPLVEPPDVCRERARRATGTQELHAGKYLGSKNEQQGARQQNSRAGRPARGSAARHAAQECGQRHRVRRQVRDPRELLLCLQILWALAKPGGHGSPPDDNLNDTDDQHQNCRDERAHRPSETGPPVERWKDDDCRSGSDDRNQTTHRPNLGKPQVRRHSSRDGRLCGVPVRRDLPRRVLIVAHARSIRPWGCPESHCAQDRAPLS